MSQILKIVSQNIIGLIVSISLLFFPQYLRAQCHLKKTIIKGLTAVETQEIYEYYRKNHMYYGVSIKLFSQQSAKEPIFFIDVKFTNSIPDVKQTLLIFILTDDSSIKTNLQFTNSQAIDNKKLDTKAYVVELKEDAKKKLLSQQLKSIALVNRKGNYTIFHVKDPLLMQTQINCLQDENIDKTQ